MFFMNNGPKFSRFFTWVLTGGKYDFLQRVQFVKNWGNTRSSWHEIWPESRVLIMSKTRQWSQIYVFITWVLTGWKHDFLSRVQHVNNWGNTRPSWHEKLPRNDVYLSCVIDVRGRKIHVFFTRNTRDFFAGKLNITFHYIFILFVYWCLGEPGDTREESQAVFPGKLLSII